MHDHRRFHLRQRWLARRRSVRVLLPADLVRDQGPIPEELGQHGDFSYGIYIVAWPLMQFGAYFGLEKAGWLV